MAFDTSSYTLDSDQYTGYHSDFSPGEEADGEGCVGFNCGGDGLVGRYRIIDGGWVRSRWVGRGDSVEELVGV